VICQEGGELKMKEVPESEVWKEDSSKILTHADLVLFAKGLSSSVGSYGRIYDNLVNMEDYQIEELDMKLSSLGLKNDLMTIIEIFEG
jgi:hypothetical protein